ncbi:sensor histidine kinase [Paenibacillus kobensis]|uniref:sensor histidine kinase n=1 Tax=Paenibacillus kobensis TaxID=59841 RepID=UPI0013E2C2A7|nr:HAMP domain-containing sensor histidine kinase [Paenibacillus kobensis]
MREELGRTGNRLELVFGGAAAFGLALLVLAGSFIASSNASKGRDERIGLFWNLYAVNYYELHKGWDGIPLLMESAAENYPEPEFTSITIKETNGQAIARFGGQASSDTVVRMPIVWKGEVVGYTETAVQSQKLFTPWIWLLAIAAGAVGFGLWNLQHARRKAAVREQAERLYWRMSALVPAAAADSGIDDIGQSEGLVAYKLEHLTQQIESYTGRLETVRRSMVADFAHELRTPLAVMRSQLENSLNAGVPLPLAKAASMHDETLHLSKLVHDLQELALAEAGKLPLEKRWFSLRLLSEAVTEALQVEADDRGIVLSLQAEKDVSVYADSARIRQLIVNLTGNAIQHARREVTVDIVLNNTGVKWTVRDDGFGIEEEQLPSLFERFYRGQSYSPSGDSRGLGLGLAIAKQYAEAHGGTITVASRWGEGTSFQVSLPIMD